MKHVIEMVSRQCDSAITSTADRAEALAMINLATSYYWRGSDERAMEWARRAQSIAIAARDEEIRAAKAAIKDRAKQQT